MSRPGCLPEFSEPRLRVRLRSFSVPVPVVTNVPEQVRMTLPDLLDPVLQSPALMELGR
jgi:hypothetical protein